MSEKRGRQKQEQRTKAKIETVTNIVDINKPGL